MTTPSKTRVEGGRRLREGPRPAAPLVSIITVVFRAKHELPPLLESIRPHLGEDAEWIVIDGGSDDGTVAYLGAHDDIIDYWLSEPDRGIYDAMNKGIAAAAGEYVLHLNAGDRLRVIPNEALRRCLTQGIDVACFGVNVAGWGDYPPRSGFRLQIENSWHHQGIFYRRSVHPSYDLAYRVFSDFDCNQKLLKSKNTVALHKEIISEQHSIGVSGSGVADEELYRIVRKNFGFHCLVLAYVWRKLTGVRILLKRIYCRFAVN